MTKLRHIIPVARSVALIGSVLCFVVLYLATIAITYPIWAAVLIGVVGLFPLFVITTMFAAVLGSSGVTRVGCGLLGLFFLLGWSGMLNSPPPADAPDPRVAGFEWIGGLFGLGLFLLGVAGTPNPQPKGDPP